MPLEATVDGEATQGYSSDVRTIVAIEDGTRYPKHRYHLLA